jgi:parvulin-like peptidyl-prolyl isomerase
VRRNPLLFGAVGVLVIVGAVVAAGAVTVPANAVTVDGVSISRATLNQDLSAIQQNAAFNCYLDASVAVRSNGAAQVPAIGGPGSSSAYNTAFVDFWLGQQINNLLIEHVATAEHLDIGAQALAAGRTDLSGSITETLSEAAAASGQSAVCAPNGASIVKTLPVGLRDELTRAQAAGDLVLAHAAGYGLSQSDLARYFASHPTQFQTICLSGIQVASQSTAASVRAQIEAGESFAAAAQANSQDTASAPNGGALGCYSANEGAYATVAQDTKGLAVGAVSQPVSNNGSYLLLEVTSVTPAAFEAIPTAVRQAVLGAGAARASKLLNAATKAASVDVDPRYGRWSPASGIGVRAPATPVDADLLKPSA